MQTSRARKRKRDSKTAELDVSQDDHNTQAAEPEQSRSPKRKRTSRTTFLSLPCELRQAILYLIVDNTGLRALIREKSARPSLPRRSSIVKGWRDTDMRWNNAFYEHIDESWRWALTIMQSTDNILILEDVHYVQEKWKEDRQELDEEWASLRER